MICTSCNKTIPDGTRYCRFCGAPAGGGERWLCSACGAALESDALFCARCGSRVAAQDDAPGTDAVPAGEALPPRVCLNCGEPMEGTDALCIHCGVRFGETEQKKTAEEPGAERRAARPPIPEEGPPARRYCISCGSRLTEESPRCPVCGAIFLYSMNEGEPAEAPEPAGSGNPSFSDEEYPPERPRGRLVWLWTLLAVAGLVAAAVGFVHVNHRMAEERLEALDFSGADEAFRRMMIADLLYSPERAFTAAGLLMEQGEYDEAIAGFTALEPYLDVTAAVTEAQYRKAAAAFKEGDLDEAIALFDALDGYKRSAALASDARFEKAALLADDGRFSDALKILRTLDADGYAAATEKIETLTELIYSHGVSKYRKGEFDAAQSAFLLLGGFERTADYLTLLGIRRAGADLDAEKTVFEALVPLIDFEDANALLLSNTALACTFLAGEWKQELYYFSMTVNKAGGWTAGYNIPRKATGTFHIENGAFITTTSKGERVTDFVMTVVSKDEITLYSAKNSTMYRLFRAE